MKRFVVLLTLAFTGTSLLANCSDGKPGNISSGIFFTADNPNIQYTGRIDFSNPKLPRAWAPGVYLKAKFAGTFCNVLVNDQAVGGNTFNYFEIIVDDTIMYRVQTTGNENVIKVVKDLANKEHTIVVCKNTEANIGYIEFKGLVCSELLTLPAKPVRKIECYGNSITCGTGSDQSSVKCGSGRWHDQHNAYLSYGPTTARALNAQWQLTSYSGIGLIRSCCNIAFTMPDIFDKLNLMPDGINWESNRYVPDVVTICLGQNDGIQDSVAFCSAYAKLLKNIRSKYLNAQLVCLTSPMADAKLTTVMKNYLTGVVGNLNASGDKNVHKFFFSRSFNSGCDNHPSLEEHKLIAGELTNYLKKLMNWD
jgi:hypothetical protein